MNDSIWSIFVLTFVPLFVVLDAAGNLPMVSALTEDLGRGLKTRTINLAILTAVVVGLAFLFFGQFLLRVMGISVGAFAVAGGLILIVLSIRYMIYGRMVDASRDEMMAVVPIGTPLLAGPATITTLIFLDTQFPTWAVLLSFCLNMLLAWLIFVSGDRILRFLGQGGLKALSKVFSLLLAAIAVDLIIRGLNLLDILNTV
ncbi:MAG: MarC family protein [Dehalococcoidia bacterium]|nr:MarC family protein [Dehalococcoidia bacterium]